MAASLVAVKSTYGQAVSGLCTACVLVIRHLPSDNSGVKKMVKMPPLWPDLRTVYDMQEQSQYNTEFLGPLCSKVGDMWAYQEEGGYVESAYINGTINLGSTSSDKNRSTVEETFRRDVMKLDEKFQLFSSALAALCVIMDRIEARIYEKHLITWSLHYGWIKENAELLFKSCSSYENKSNVI